MDILKGAVMLVSRKDPGAQIKSENMTTGVLGVNPKERASSYTYFQDFIGRGEKTRKVFQVIPPIALEIPFKLKFPGFRVLPVIRKNIPLC
jgi:hypothetical protein